MAVNVRRLRWWLGVSALVLVLAVSGFIVYGRYRIRQALRGLPQKLGANIQQTANGFTYSQSEGGRTLFTIHASQMVQFRTGNRAELKDVNITIYGKDSNRFDQIYGAGFEYDPSQQVIRASGEVDIDLQADKEGAQHPDQAPPRELKNQVHVKTSGLSFNQKTGIAETAERLEFRTAQASGSAVGAVYDSRQRTLSLKKDVHLVTQASALPPAMTKPASGRHHSAPGAENAPVEIVAAAAMLRNESRSAELERATATRGLETASADHVRIELREDSSVARVLATGGVHAVDRGPEASELRTARMELFLNDENELQHAELSGGAQFAANGQRPVHGSAGRVHAFFGAENALQRVEARDAVDVVEEPPAAGNAPMRRERSTPNARHVAKAQDAGRAQGADAQEVKRIEVKAPALDLYTRGGRSLERAETAGPGEILLTQDLIQGAALNNSSLQDANAVTANAPSSAARSSAGATVTTISAPMFHATFDANNHLQAVHGEGRGDEPARIVSTTPNQPDRVTSSRSLDATFASRGAGVAGGISSGISSIVQSGDFQYREGTRSAAGQQARFTAAGNTLQLSGAPRYSDDEVSVTADTLSLDRSSGEMRASGDVKTTYLAAKAKSSSPASASQKNASMFSSASPVHVTSRELVAQRSSGNGRFSGDARMWQGANLVQAPVINFDREHRTLEAESAGSLLVESVFVQTSAKGRTTPANVTAKKLVYAGGQNEARFEDGVTVRGADGTLTADHVDVFLKENAGLQLGRQSRQNGSSVAIPSAAGEPSSGAAQIDHIIAQGQVTIVQPGRKATGDHLLYVAAEQRFTLTGGPPSIFDAEHGQITGDSLTFFSQDDRVLIDSPANGSASRTVIHTRVAK